MNVKKIFSLFNKFIIGFITGILAVFGIKRFITKIGKEVCDNGESVEEINGQLRRIIQDNRQLDESIGELQEWNEQVRGDFYEIIDEIRKTEQTS